MNNAFLSNNFGFFKVKINKFHYTDNRTSETPNYLALMLKGNAKIVYGRTVLEIAEGDIFFIPKNLGYESFWYGDQIEWISLGFSDFPESNYKKYILQKIVCDDQTKKLFFDIRLNEPISSHNLGTFYTLLSLILPKMKTEEKSPVIILVNEAKRQMTLHSDLEIPKIARLCGVSESTLYSAFKKVLNITPNEVRLEILAEKAVLLLTTTDKSVEEISSNLGFSSASYFRKILNKTIGKTPREIRKNNSTL